MIKIRKYWIVNGDKGEAIKVNREVDKKGLEIYREELKKANPNKEIFFDYINYGTK